MIRRLAAALLAAALVTACAGGSSVTGIVVEVDGTISNVRSFVLRTTEGEELTFVPAAGIDFNDAPLSHLRDHLRSGEPVRVDYEERDGALIAERVTDA